MNTIAVFIAAKDTRTPIPAKLVSFAVAVYALSPIDLIPDFIPIIGYLDDLIIVPAGLWLAIRLIPSEVMIEALVKAHEIDKGSIHSRYIGAIIVASIWIVALQWLYLRILHR